MELYNTLTIGCDIFLASLNEDSLRLCNGGNWGEGGPLSRLGSTLKPSPEGLPVGLLKILKKKCFILKSILDFWRYHFVILRNYST